jgi:hypothetical protein
MLSLTGLREGLNKDLMKERGLEFGKLGCQTKFLVYYQTIFYYSTFFLSFNLIKQTPLTNFPVSWVFILSKMQI